MGELKLNENVLGNISLLAAGAACLATGGGAVAAFGLFAAPAMELAKTPLKNFLQSFKTKDPENYRAIERIQGKINQSLIGDARFKDCPSDLMGKINQSLPRALSQTWPSVDKIAELATDKGGFPTAIANHIILEFKNQSFVDDSLIDPAGEAYVCAIIEAAMKAALQDETYFAALQPQLLMTTLGMTGVLARKMDALNAPLTEIKETTLGNSDKLDDLNLKVEALQKTLLGNESASPQADDFIKQTVTEMLSSDREATKLAVADLMANPSDPHAATRRLKQAIAKRSDARLEARDGEIELLKEVAAINYYIGLFNRNTRPHFGAGLCLTFD